MPADPSTSRGRVALVTLGCARNEVDSEELAGRLAADGWTVVDEAAAADVAVVNTCGFVEAAKKDSVDVLLETADLKGGRSGGDGGPRTRSVVAVGCLAERYGAELAEALPEADAVLGFDDYSAISERLTAALSGAPHRSHAPRDRRRLLPIAPAERQRHRTPGEVTASPAAGPAAWPADRPADGPADWRGPGRGPRPLRRRLSSAPVAPLKLASGCDRRCAFCAIPAFRGAFVSRPPDEVLAEARWLADQGVRELVLVSENSTSYGKDLGDVRLLEGLLPRLAALDGVDRVRVSYLQPAELRPTLVEVLAATPGVAAYFDLSFQHASGPVLRRMRRFGDADRFLELLCGIRGRAPLAGARSNVIVGFPGETEADVAELERFLTEARLDAVGVFGYSDEDGTEAQGLDGKLPEPVVRERVERVTRLAEELCAQRAEERVGEQVDVLVEQAAPGGGAEGRAAHQAPEVDGTISLVPAASDTRDGSYDGAVPLEVGRMVRARVTAASGLDLVGVPLGEVVPAGAGAGE